MKRYLVSACCVRQNAGLAVDVDHFPFVVEAVSLDEAIGRATRIVEKSYRDADGWRKRSVNVQADDGERVLTVEGAAITRG